jgi:hypothetical protein
MEQSSDTIIDLKGNALPGVAIRVFANDGSLAQLFSDNGLTPVSNPTYTDQNGRYIFYAANGRYTTRIEPPDGAEYDGKEVVLFDPADNGAASIEFLQNGVGAVPRDVSVELQDRVSVRQFGAKGDGVTDDTAAIQAALTFGAGRRVEFPAGLYMTRGNHIVPHDTAVAGDGWLSKIQVINGSNPAYIFTSGSESAFTTVDFYDIYIDGNKAGNPTGGKGIHLIRPVRCHLTNANIRNCHGDNIVLEANNTGFGSILRDCWSYGSDGVGIRMQGGGITDVHIINGDIGYNAEAGVVLATSCSVTGAVIWGEQLPNSVGVLTAGLSWQIIGCKIEGHGRYGIVVSTGNSFGFISGNKIYANSFNVGTTGQYDGIYIEPNANYGTITGNKFYASVSPVTPYLMRYAVNFSGTHESWTVCGNDMSGLGVQGIPTTTRVVNGILETDRFDGNWIRTSVKARLSANVNATAANAWTVLPYDLEDSDPMGEFANGTFTPKNSGRYRIEAAITCAPAAAGENLGIALYTSTGTAIRRLAFFRSEGTNVEMAAGCLDEFLTAGTAYDIRYLVGSTSTQFQAGGPFTYARIRAVPN